MGYILSDDPVWIDQILQLQSENLPEQINIQEQAAEGFVTVRHTPEQLQAIFRGHPAALLTDSGRLGGYALVMISSLRDTIPVLIPMFEEIDAVWQEAETNTPAYVVMGQICIDKIHRRKGHFRGLYQLLQTSLADRFDEIITEVDVMNRRSLSAHLAIGFREIRRYTGPTGQEWSLLALKTAEASGREASA